MERPLQVRADDRFSPVAVKLACAPPYITNLLESAHMLVLLRKNCYVLASDRAKNFWQNPRERAE